MASKTFYYCDRCYKDMTLKESHEIADKTKQPDCVYFDICKKCYKKFKEFMKNANNKIWKS